MYHGYAMLCCYANVLHESWNTRHSQRLPKVSDDVLPMLRGHERGIAMVAAVAKLGYARGYPWVAAGCFRIRKN